MDDLIRRADAIEAVERIGSLDTDADREYARSIIDALPSAVCDDCIWTVCNYNKVDWDAPPAEAEWIPVSERLPEDGVAVLITTENEEVYIDQVITDPYKERYFQSNTGYDNFQVLAWMPLPKPYKAKSEVEK